MKINLITYTDCTYLQHAVVMLASLNDLASSENEYRVYLIHSCSDEGVLNKSRTTFASFSSNIMVQDQYVDFGLAGVLKSKKKHINASIYDKILIYQKLSSDIDRVVFIDADIVLKRDPAELFQVDLKGRILAAVKDSFLKFSKQARDTIALNSPDDYFNSGVMVIDLKQWKERKIDKIALEFAKNKGHLTQLHDQDALNYAVHGNWTSISPLWNPRPENEVDVNGHKRVLSKLEVYESDMAYLIHYSGSDKPWLYLSDHPGKRDYLKYLAATDFKNYQYPDYNLRNFFIKIKKELKKEMKHYKNKIS